MSIVNLCRKSLKTKPDVDKYTKLLLHLDGDNNSTNIIDSSIYNKTINTVGDAKISTDYSKYGNSCLSCITNPSYVIPGRSSEFYIGQDFMFEFWIKTTNSSTQVLVAGFGTNVSWGAGAWWFGLNYRATGLMEWIVNEIADPVILCGPGCQKVNDGLWHHIAVLRTGNTYKIYTDGLLCASAISSNSITDASNAPVFLGRDWNGWQFNGYMDEIRFTVGKTRPIQKMWTDIIVPPQAFSSDANTSLLLHMDGADSSTTFIDSSSYSHTVTCNGNTNIKTDKSIFGGSSALFDGNGDYLNITWGTEFQFGTGDFTMEAFVYFNQLPTATADWPNDWTNHMQFIGIGTPNATDGPDFTINSKYIFIVNQSDAIICRGCHDFVTGKWYHIAASRSGNNFYIFIDGVLVGYSICTDDFNGTFTNCYIGAETGQGAFFNGYMDEVRISKGIARYTSTFTPPPRQYSNIQ